jgi:hypothetical protein
MELQDPTFDEVVRNCHSHPDRVAVVGPAFQLGDIWRTTWKMCPIEQAAGPAIAIEVARRDAGPLFAELLADRPRLPSSGIVPAVLRIGPVFVLQGCDGTYARPPGPQADWAPTPEAMELADFVWLGHIAALTPEEWAERLAESSDPRHRRH